MQAGQAAAPHARAQSRARNLARARARRGGGCEWGRGVAAAAGGTRRTCVISAAPMSQRRHDASASPPRARVSERQYSDHSGPCGSCDRQGRRSGVGDRWECACVCVCVGACSRVCVCACVRACVKQKAGVCVVVVWGGGVNHLQRDVRRREALERRKLRHRRQHVLRVHLHAPATRRRDSCKTSERRRRRHKRAYATSEQGLLDGRWSGLVWFDFVPNATEAAAHGLGRSAECSRTRSRASRGVFHTSARAGLRSRSALCWW